MTDCVISQRRIHHLLASEFINHVFETVAVHAKHLAVFDVAVAASPCCTGRSFSINSWQFYNLAYGIDGNVAFFEATGKKEYLDRALTYAENCVASAEPSKSLPASQFKDDYLGWPAMNHPLDRSIRGGEYPLYESYCWRYVTRLLRVMRRTPAIWDDDDYRRRYTALLDFTEKLS